MPPVDDDGRRRRAPRLPQRWSDYADADELEVWYDRVDVDRLLGFFESEDARPARHVHREAGAQAHQPGCVEKLTETCRRAPRISETRRSACTIDDPAGGAADEVVDDYRDVGARPPRHLLDRSAFVDAVRQVVGVGSVGMQVYLVLLEGRGGDDPLFLQIKQAGPSVYERTSARAATATTASGWSTASG